MQFDLGEKTTLSADVVKAMKASKNDIYMEFTYMGYRWVVKMNRNVLGKLVNADGTLNLLKFISSDYMEYIVKAEAIMA